MLPREQLPTEFARDHKIAQALYDPGEEIWQHRLRLTFGVEQIRLPTIPLWAWLPITALGAAAIALGVLCIAHYGCSIMQRRDMAQAKVRALEDHLGASLFGRLHRGIELTIDGRMLLEGVRAGLDSVLLASERVRSQRRVGVLTVAAPAAFATWWLVPCLGRFAALHPEIEVRIAAMDGREPDLWRDGVDVVGLPPFAKALSNGEVAPEAGIFEPQNLRQSAVAFHVGG